MAKSISKYNLVKNDIKNAILIGKFHGGELIPTEMELCAQYGVSRFPVRQALTELCDDGFLTRINGKCTVVNKNILMIDENKCGMIGLILPNLSCEYSSNIITGFYDYAIKHKYLAASTCSNYSSESEMDCLYQMISKGIRDIALFQTDQTDENAIKAFIESKKANITFIDRHPDIVNISYVGADNFGGAYTATRHLIEHNFKNVAFLTYGIDKSSVLERFNGYIKAVVDFNAKCLTMDGVADGLQLEKAYDSHFILDDWKKCVEVMKKYENIGIIGCNDDVMMRFMSYIHSEGDDLEKKCAFVGFDNTMEGKLNDPKLTSVDLNGKLIGTMAAEIVINRMVTNSEHVYTRVAPMQLIIRDSCVRK